MKKYVVSLLLLIAYSACAMELTKLSHEDDAKALRLAKLCNKYPYGYGENKQCIDATREKIDWFLNKVEPLCIRKLPFGKCLDKSDKNKKHIDVAREKRKRFFQQFEYLSSRVKQYQTILNNMEALELLNCMHEPLPCDVKSEIFTIALHDDAWQYYAMSNAMKFVILEPWLITSSGYYSGVADWYAPCFLAELHEDGRPTICFSDDGVTCELYGLDRSIVKAYSPPRYTGNTLRLQIPGKKPFTSELITFVSQDSKKARIDAFKQLFASWVEYLSSETNKEKYTNAFIELLKRLNWHNIELSDENDCKEVLKRESTLYNIENW